MKFMPRKRFLICVTAILPFLITSCSINRSLYPIQSDDKVDAAVLTGVWTGKTQPYEDSEATLVKAKICTGERQGQLKVNLTLTQEDDEDQVDQVFPLCATIYELNGVKFLNLAADEKVFYQMIENAGYSAKGVTRGLFHPWFFLFKIEYDSNKIQLSSVIFAEQDEHGKSGKPLSSAARFDRSKGILLNSSGEINDIIGDKGCQFKPLITLVRTQ